MSATASISNSDKINYLNIGLMLLSLIVAFYVPFELFLFSYAVLGPAHYLTEISWLHERKYFSNGKRDYIFLGVAGTLLFLVLYVFKPYNFLSPSVSDQFSTALVYLAFCASFAMVLFKESYKRFIAFLVILLCIAITKNASAVLFFSVFLPTLIHVYLFTGLFMLYGALKGRSKTGYISCLLFAICPFLIFWIAPDAFVISNYAHKTYKYFEAVNIYSLNFWDPNTYKFPFSTKAEYDTMFAAIYNSKLGLSIMRFIAFAYTYHYLNWFSKTSVIKWHQVPKKRLIIIGALWLISVGFYYYDYKLGFDVLFLLSFLHVFLEFPLNHVTFLGIFKELGSISGLTKTPVPVKGNPKGNPKMKKK